MEDLIKTLVEQAPNLVGLAILAYVLYRQNNTLLATLIERIDTLEEKVEQLSKQVSAS